MGTKYILLWLESPLQSWGYDSLFDRRDTLYFPTKSGLAGLVLSAMGRRGKQEELLAKLNQYPQSVISYSVPWDSDSMPVKKGMLCDFHMVGSGYKLPKYAHDEWYQGHVPRKIDGKKSVGGGSRLTYRYYLQGASYAVFLQCEEDLAQDIKEALTLPIYDIYLGRKCCVPTDFLYRGSYDSLPEAMGEAECIVAEKESVDSKAGKSVKGLRKVFTVKEGEGHELQDGETLFDCFYLSDVPKSFGVHKVYGGRMVSVILHSNG